MYLYNNSLFYFKVNNKGNLFRLSFVNSGKFSVEAEHNRGLGFTRLYVCPFWNKEYLFLINEK